MRSIVLNPFVLGKGNFRFRFHRFIQFLALQCMDEKAEEEQKIFLSMLRREQKATKLINRIDLF